RHMHSAGHRDLIVYLCVFGKETSALFKAQLHRAQLHGIKIVDLQNEENKWDKILSSTLVVDAIFGIGLSKAVSADFLKAIDKINSVKVPVVSLDCPSGLNVDTGMVQGASVTATTTLSFGLAKPGFFVSQGPHHVGNLRVLPIGFPFETLRGVATTHFVFNERLARRYLPQRRDTSNKSDFGHACLFAGSELYWGAGVLASSSAYRMGCGYVTWASFVKPLEHAGQIPEVLFSEVEDDKIWDESKVTAYAIGPGLGVNEKTAHLIERLKKQSRPVVVDADAITTCVQYDLFPLPPLWIITPHSGELSRILKRDAREIESDRYQAALEASRKVGCHVLLKGYHSVIAFEERTMVINAGNSSLAKAGTGDVLTGMIVGLLAQGLETLQASATACYIHGRIADEWVRVGNNARSLLASDLKDHLPNLMTRLESGAIF
ncbi:MAG: NAD(P)H-hydrate dehydratase, partial [Bdellovibrionales bacterium]|nr:NAD(P)H-hydrate dehydratase [Bdellovibrionales bacterium]